jgi:cobalt-zinc-cadmium efflux system protein
MGHGHHHHGPDSHGEHHHDHHGHAHHHGGHAHFVEIPENHPTLLSQRHFRALRWVFWLTFLYLIVEVVGGLLSGSLALLADGFHMFGDAGAIGISLFAQWYSHKPAPEHRTFGYQRLEILAALFNAVSLIAMGVFILLESYTRFQSPVPIHADMMVLIAFGGLIVNIVSAKLLHGDHQHNLNIKGAYLHVLGDLLGSIGAIAAGVLIWLFHWAAADPIISAIIALLITYSAFGLLKEAVNVLLEGCPSHIDIEEIRAVMLHFEGVRNVHHLHVWNINLQRIVLTAHLEVTPDAFSGDILNTVQNALKHQFGLSHVTLQLELA